VTLHILFKPTSSDPHYVSERSSVIRKGNTWQEDGSNQVGKPAHSTALRVYPSSLPQLPELIHITVWTAVSILTAENIFADLNVFFNLHLAITNQKTCREGHLTVE
jgi:hypothetical protein